MSIEWFNEMKAWPNQPLDINELIQHANTPMIPGGFITIQVPTERSVATQDFILYLAVNEDWTLLTNPNILTGTEVAQVRQIAADAVSRWQRMIRQTPDERRLYNEVQNAIATDQVAPF